MTEATQQQWQTICPAKDIAPSLGVRALFNGEQVAIFNVNDTFFAIDAIDPFTRAAVLARGIVGGLGGDVVVASPIYKQHFNLKTGQCLEDDAVKLTTYSVRNNAGVIELAPAV